MVILVRFWKTYRSAAYERLSTLLRSLTALGDVIEAWSNLIAAGHVWKSFSWAFFSDVQKETQTNKQTDKQTNRQTNKTNKQTNKQITLRHQKQSNISLDIKQITILKEFPAEFHGIFPLWTSLSLSERFVSILSPPGWWLGLQFSQQILNIMKPWNQPWEN